MHNLQSVLSAFVFSALFAAASFAVIPEKRAFQLDSITTNIPRDIRRDLSSVHRHLDQLAQDDEEKVWMFYGYIGTYFKYDSKRKKDYKAKDYSPEYTAQRSNGVCRDFAKVFATMCQKSNIPCMEVRGKVPGDIFQKTQDFLHGYSMDNMHAWNIVRINGEWQLMDPTWTGIDTTQKIKTWIPKKKTYLITLVKSVRRNYYNPSPEFMAETHVPVHPAFFMLPDIPLYKSALKKQSRWKWYARNYAFTATLDTIWSAEYPQFSKTLHEGSVAYSKISYTNSDYRYELALPLLKTSRYNPPTIEGYDRALAHATAITAYIQTQLNLNYTGNYAEFEKELKKRREKLIKLQESKKKKKSKVG